MTKVLVFAMKALSLTAVLASGSVRSRRDLQPLQGRVFTMHEEAKPSCGNWMRDYTQMHAGVRSGLKPPRYLMVQAKATSGIADVFACVTSAFLCALLSKRAFLINENDESSRLSVAYSTPHIDWTVNHTELKNLSTSLVHGIMTNGQPFEGPDIDTFRWGNLSGFGANEELLVFDDCNAGLIVPLFDNPLYKSQLFRLGLMPEAAYGCIISFLFKVRSRVMDIVKKELEPMENSSSFKIGIHIRTGDPAMVNQKLEWPSQDEAEGQVAEHAAYFSCALKIEETVARASNKQSIWLLLSDSAVLRKSAVLKYGSKIVTNVDSDRTPRHVKTSQGGGGENAMILSAGEHWLFSLADYHIFGEGGFGKSGALSSIKWGFYNVVQEPSCKPMSVRELSRVMPGV